MIGEAATAEHKGDIWSRPPTTHSAILTGKNQRFLLGISMKESEPNPHLHIHVRPRSDKPVMVNGSTYIDSEFGHHYAVNKSGVISVKDKEEVFTRPKEWLNRYYFV